MTEQLTQEQGVNSLLRMRVDCERHAATACFPMFSLTEYCEPLVDMKRWLRDVS